MEKVLEDKGGELKFSPDVAEFILDKNMELKAVRLRNGKVVDHEHLHTRFNPKHPLLSSPEKVKHALDQFFVHEFKEKRSVC
ncbi:MAG: hypothetical protein KKD39_05600 [Candidatus Altiarchaeota archaeon]|nr:hypothetical protein [Candidatus Altiarchaeota archaeon]